MAVNQALVRMYVNLIQNGRKTIDQVPAEYKEAVAAALAAAE